MVPVIGFAAPSGMGKTTLMAEVIRCLQKAGLRVAAIKHGHHAADPDVPGKDSHRFREAGAEGVIFASPHRWFMIQELDGVEEPGLQEHLERFKGYDLVLVEGYRDYSHPKIAVYRKEKSGDLSWLHGMRRVVAVATDDRQLTTEHPLLPLNDPQYVAWFILRYFGLKK